MLSTRLPYRIFKGLQRTDPRRTWRRGMVEGRKGLILGAWEECGGDKIKLTKAAAEFDGSLQGKLMEKLKDAKIKKGTAQLVHDIGGYYAVAVCGIGPEGLGYDEQETLHECRENVRLAASKGITLLQEQDVSTVCVDPMSSADAAAEGAKLAVYSFQDFLDPEKRLATPEINLFSTNSQDREMWLRGSVLADGQNTARALCDSPANVMTPKHFAEEAIRILCPCGVHVNVRHIRWIEDQKMFAFLNIAKGSCEPPFFLEINYCGGQEADRPVVLAGKGVTFDSGGLCLKSCRSQGTFREDMADYRAAMCGAANVVGAIKALARLGIPINVVGLIPLMENMPGGTAVKPGDVVLAVDQKTIVVEDTDNEGRLILADTLCYSDHFKPCLDVVIANLHHGGRDGIGSGATPTFSSSQIVWDEIKKAGATTGDRVWRFPLWKQYTRRVRSCPHVDMCNVGKGGPQGSPCLAAAFLYEFVPGCDYMLLDLTGTGMRTRGIYAPYLRSGFMTGRPTRTVAQFLNNMACPLDEQGKCGGV